MARIIAPNKNYNGISASITFRDGVGETANPYLIKWFREHGYKVEEPLESGQNQEPSDNQEPSEPLEMNPDMEAFKEMNLDELKAYAQDNGIDIGQARTETGIREKIEKALTKE